MSATKVDECDNTYYLDLAKDAPLGSVLTWIEGVYAWRVRDPKWKGALLTKTENGYELIDENGKSYGILNLGEDYSGILLNPSCTECAKEYLWRREVTCIPPTDTDSGFGKCGQQWEIKWCPLCQCFGIIDITSIETPIETNTAGTLFVYDIPVREACDCEGKVLVQVTKTEININPM